MTKTLASFSAHSLLDSQYLSAAIQNYRQRVGMSANDLAILAKVDISLVEALESKKTIQSDALDILRLLEVIFSEQFNNVDLEAYSQRIARINRQQLAINALVSNSQIYDAGFKAAAEVIVKTVACTLQVEFVGIWLFDSNAENLMGISAYSLTSGEDEIEDYSRCDYPKFFQHAVARRTIVADYTQPNLAIAEFASQDAAEWGISSALATTVYIKNHPLGVIFSEHVGEKRIWQADEVSFHNSVANVITLAHMNAQSKNSRDRQLEKQRDYHLAIFELSKQKAIIDGDMELAVPQITEKVANVLQVEIVDIWLMNEEKNALIGLNEYCLSAQQHSIPSNYSREQFPRFFKAFEQERVVAVHDVISDERTNEDRVLFVHEGICSLLAVASRAKGEVVAVISMEHVGEFREWLPDEIAFAGEVSEQLSQLVINYKNEQEQVQQFRKKIVDKNCRQATNGLLYNSLYEQADYRKGIEEVCRLVSEALEVEYVGSYLFDDEKTYLNGVALYARSRKDFIYSGDYEYAEGKKFYSLLEKERRLVCYDAASDKRYDEFVKVNKEFNVNASVDVGVFSGDQMIGLFTVEYVKDKRVWLDEEVALCVAAAEKIGYILKNNDRRLAEQAYQQQLLREKIQNQAILRLIKGQASLDNDRQMTIEEVCKLTAEVLQVEYVGLYFYDDKREKLTAESLYQLSTTSFWMDEDSYEVAKAKNYYLELEEHRTLTSTDCSNDERLKDFDYIEEDGVQATADTVIRVNGVSVGLLNVESLAVRTWYPDEVAYMGAVADHLAQVILADQMRKEGDAYISVAKRRQELEHMINYGQFVLIDWVGDNWDVKFISESVSQFGYSAESFYQGKVNFFDRIYAADADIVQEKFQQFETNDKATKINYEYRLLTVDGEIRWVEDYAQVVRGEDNTIERYYSVIHDITARKLMEQSLLESKEKMQRMAFYDALTGLENRALFKQQLDHAIKSSRRQKKPVVLLYLDIDNFKLVNDTLGHDAGDTLLKIVADRLLACVRADDTVARIGGDEFTVLLTEVKGRAGAKRAAEKIINMFNKPIRLNDQELIVSTSIGITLCPEDGVDSTLLMKNADLAMYHAKASGRNNFQFYTEHMNSELSKRVFLEAELRQALANNQFELYFQPIVDLNTLQCVSVEALVRWHHPERGLVPPDEFIPVAEDTGLIIPLGEQIFIMACAQAALLMQAGMGDIKIAVNLSARQFHDPNLLSMVKQYLQQSGIEARQLGLEVTESLLMDKVENAIVTLQELKGLGFSLSIDDFGTGYSSLSYLKRLPIDTVKVDRSFVRDIPQDRNDMEITAAVIAMAHKLNLSVIAEGVEELEQQLFLMRNDCNYAQGYYYSRPIPGGDLVAVITDIAAKAALQS